VPYTTAPVYRSSKSPDRKRRSIFALPALDESGKTKEDKLSEEIVGDTMLVGVAGLIFPRHPYSWVVTGFAAAAMVRKFGTRGILPGGLAFVTTYLGARAEETKKTIWAELLNTTVPAAEASETKPRE